MILESTYSVNFIVMEQDHPGRIQESIVVQDVIVDGMSPISQSQSCRTDRIAVNIAQDIVIDDNPGIRNIIMEREGQYSEKQTSYACVCPAEGTVMYFEAFRKAVLEIDMVIGRPDHE